MGTSALRLVLAQSQVVAPQKGDQPPYVRSKHAVQTSAALKQHQNCVRKALDGKRFDNATRLAQLFGKAFELLEMRQNAKKG